ncbi:MAG: sigma-70 family RNA polymerase sigma factor [Bacteroidetes bacterium]|jgi:RNA polymerase sigma factor (TIGR02999 family)|nr:sigma-70 family RNA polymerase sigma factor [Bacteroidota bacterium]
MIPTPKHTFTRLLEDYSGGDKEAFGDLFEYAYDELYRVAKAKRLGWRGNETLNTTAILHEAYLKLVDQSKINWKNRTHFFALASKAMRQILMNYARNKNRQKRGGDRKKVTLERLNLAATNGIDISDELNDTMVMLDEALKQLEAENPRQAEIVECLFFGGMTIDETASALGVSSSTVKRGWKTAQLWLYRELRKTAPEECTDRVRDG